MILLDFIKKYINRTTTGSGEKAMLSKTRMLVRRFLSPLSKLKGSGPPKEALTAFYPSERGFSSHVTFEKSRD